MFHLVNTTSLGKTLGLRGGASNWGEGSDPAVPTSFIEPWKTTGNASENLLAAHNHIGFCLDEMKSIDAEGCGVVRLRLRSRQGQGPHEPRPGQSRRRLACGGISGLSAGEITLTERSASETSHRSQPGDAGAEARVINIMPEIIFEDWHGCSSAKEAAVKFGVMCIENCGWSGPAYVEWLASHGDEARAAIIKNLAAWDAIAVLMLGVDPFPAGGAGRLASGIQWRRGPPLPRRFSNFRGRRCSRLQEGEFIAAPARAMTQGFSPGSWASGSPTMA